jgi:hypothetical protein
MTYFVVVGADGWCMVVTFAPEGGLELAKRQARLALVEALQHAVVTFVQPPVLLEGNPLLTNFRRDNVVRLDGSL